MKLKSAKKSSTLEAFSAIGAIGGVATAIVAAIDLSLPIMVTAAVISSVSAVSKIFSRRARQRADIKRHEHHQIMLMHIKTVKHQVKEEKQQSEQKKLAKKPF